MNKIGLVLIGYGGMGSIYAEKIRSLRDTELLYVVGTNEKKLNQFVKDKCEEYTKPITDLKEALKDDKVKGVIIASPSDTHLKFIMQSLDSGRSVMCEKPLNTNLNDTIKCYEKAKEKNLILLTAFQRRYDKSFSQLKKKLEEKVIGDIPELIKITSRDPDTGDKPQENSHPIWDSLSHDFDMAYWLAGEQEVDQVYCVQPSSNSVLVAIKFSGGTIATIDWEKGIKYGYDQRVEVHSSEGMLQVNNEPLSLVNMFDQEGKKSDIFQPFFPERYSYAYEKQTEHFLDCIKDPKKDKTVTDKQVIAGTRIAILALESLKKNNEDKFLSIDAPKLDVSLGTHHSYKIEGKKIGICLIGAGRMGNIRANLISKEERCNLLYIVDIEEKAGSKLANEYGCKFSNDLSLALSDNDVHVVWVCVPTQHHFKIIKEVVKHKKHIYCEKSVSLKMEEVEESYRLAKENGVLLMCGSNKRFDDQNRKVYQILKEKKENIGSPSIVCLHNGNQTNFTKRAHSENFCIFKDVMIDEIDLSLWISNQSPSSVYSLETSSQKDSSNYGIILMTFPDESSSLITARSNSPHGFDQRLEILTKKGALLQSENTPTKGILSSGTDKENKECISSKLDHSTAKHYKTLSNEISHLADVLLKGVPPLTSYQQNHLSSFVSEMAKKSSMEKKTILLR